jgi:hypothetical protein
MLREPHFSFKHTLKNEIINLNSKYTSSSRPLWQTCWGHCLTLRYRKRRINGFDLLESMYLLTQSGEVLLTYIVLVRRKNHTHTRAQTHKHAHTNVYFIDQLQFEKKANGTVHTFSYILKLEKKFLMRYLKFIIKQTTYDFLLCSPSISFILPRSCWLANWMPSHSSRFLNNFSLLSYFDHRLIVFSVSLKPVGRSQWYV